MTTPPGEGDRRPDGADEPADAPFDPYRFGAPEHPVPPEYAPPGYVPPPQPSRPEPGPPSFSPLPAQHYGSRYSSPYPPPPPHPHGYNTGARGSNGKSIASLVLGIGSILLCWISIFDLVPIIAAVIFGVLGLNEAKHRGDGHGRGMAIAGLVCAAVGALLAIVLSIYLYSLVKDCLDYPSGSAAQNHCIRQKI